MRELQELKLFVLGKICDTNNLFLQKLNVLDKENYSSVTLELRQLVGTTIALELVRSEIEKIQEREGAI